ncbi:DUF6266 family protein [Pedobacter sp. AW1-32]|uniref:DUF6266 family protein n=1 Tax=Pedobacter sp. AW1-32 TaxID=3383026 RepID=UPI003FF12BAD
MARIKNGIMGAFSGKVGSVVGVSYRNGNYLRSLPATTKTEPTVKQLASRARFKFFNAWRNPLSPFFAITFQNQTETFSAQNAAHFFNKGAVTGDYPDFKLDFQKIVISQGDLPPVLELKMEQSEADRLRFTWLPNLLDKAKATDLLALLICYENDVQVIDSVTNGAERIAGAFDFILSGVGKGKVGHVYVTFIANDRKKAANSVYLGEVRF